MMTRRTGMRVWVGSAIAGMVAIGVTSWGADLTGNRDLSAGAAIPLTNLVENTDQSVARQAGGYWHFGDRLGDGSGTNVTPAGLGMGAYSLFNTANNTVPINLNLNGGDIVGDAGAVAFNTQRGNSADTAAINIRGVRDMTVGTLRTLYAASFAGNQVGAIQIGVNTTEGRARDLIINGLQTYSSRHSGAITIYGSGHVLIKNHSTDALSSVDSYNTGSRISGAINIQHDGSFAAANVRAFSSGVYSIESTGANVTLNGDVANDGVSGTFRVTGSIQTYQGRAGGEFTRAAGHVAIANYQGVTIGGNIETYNLSIFNNIAGNVTITGIVENIAIAGALNLNSSYSDNNDGILTLSCGGTNTLASLDLANVRQARFSAGSDTYLTGALSGFSGARTNNLRCPVGQTVFYDPRVAGNVYLGALAHPLKDWDGTTAGGTLAPVPLEAPTVVTLPAGNITTNSADLIGFLGATGTATTAVHVYWGPGGDQGTNGVWNYTNEVTLAAESQTTYTNPVSPLTPAQGYTYRYFAANEFGGHWGAAVSFTNLQSPAVSDVSTSNVSWATADLSATVTAGYPAPNLYILVKAGSEPALDGTNGWDVVVSAGVRSGAYTTFIQGLDTNTTYYCRAYVTNVVGDAWSGLTVFTPEAAQPSSLVLSNNHTVTTSTTPLTFSNTVARLVRDSASYYDFANLGANPMAVSLAGFYLLADSGVSILMDLNGGSLSGTAATSLRTYRAGDCGDVTLRDVGDVAVGAIATYTTGSGYGGSAGDVTIGQSSDRAGNIRVNGIDAKGTASAGWTAFRAGAVTLYGAGEVLIQSASATPASINTTVYNHEAGGNQGVTRYNNVTVNHAGDFAADQILTWAAYGYTYNYANPGKVVLNGDGPGNGASGSCTVNDIYTYVSFGGGGASAAGPVTISGYTNVSVRHINTSNNAGAGTAEGTTRGDVTITNITGDIAITGTINLNHAAGPTHDGNLSLHCGNRVTLAALDKSNVRDVRFSVTLNGAKPKRTWMWVWIQSEPTNFTVDDDNKTVVGFTAVDSHVYYTDSGGSLAGDYAILIGGNPSGFSLIELAVGETPPEVPGGGAVLFFR